MKTIYVRTKTLKEAIERSRMLYRILLTCTPVFAELQQQNRAVQTKNVYVRYMHEQRHLDGLCCDIPCGFGGHGKVMARGKKYKELSDEWEIADFIEKEEQRQQKEEQHEKRIFESSL